MLGYWAIRLNLPRGACVAVATAVVVVETVKVVKVVTVLVAENVAVTVIVEVGVIVTDLVTGVNVETPALTPLQLQAEE